jgi:hypothetical protein
VVWKEGARNVVSSKLSGVADIAASALSVIVLKVIVGRAARGCDAGIIRCHGY